LPINVPHLPPDVKNDLDRRGGDKEAEQRSS